MKTVCLIDKDRRIRLLPGYWWLLFMLHRFKCRKYFKTSLKQNKFT